MGVKKVRLTNGNDIRTILQEERVINDSITVGEFLETHDKFMEDKMLNGLRSRTIKDNIEHLKYFRKYLEESYRSDINRIADRELNFNAFKSYLAYMALDKKYSAYTVNSRLCTLKCYLKWLFHNKYLSEDYSTRLKKQKVDEDMIKPLTTEEVKKILKVCDINTLNGLRDYCLMLLMLETGVRVGEATEIQIEDIDLKQGLITIKGSVSKTGRVRILPISSKMCKLLKELIRIAEESKTAYVFQSTYGGKIKKQNIILSFERLGKKAGINKRCTPHVWRHTMAVNAVRSGMDIWTLQKIMGHSTIVTTRKYIQLETTDLKRAHDKFCSIDKFLKWDRE
jgi:integrase/recombinase XerD